MNRYKREAEVLRLLIEEADRNAARYQVQAAESAQETKKALRSVRVAFTMGALLGALGAVIVLLFI